MLLAARCPQEELSGGAAGAGQAAVQLEHGKGNEADFRLWAGFRPEGPIKNDKDFGSDSCDWKAK